MGTNVFEWAMPKPASAAAVSSGHVLQLVRDGRAATRADIGRLTGLSRPAVALRVGELMRQGLVTEGEAAPSSGGRPPGRLEFNAAGGVVLAATLGISTSQIAVCDLAGRVLVQDSGSPDVEHGPHAALPWLLDTWADLLAKCGRGPGDVRGTGIGVPAPWSSPPGAPRPRRCWPAGAASRSARWWPSASRPPSCWTTTST